MKLVLAQLNYHIGNLEANTQKIIGAITKAKHQGADLVIFAELALCGYPPLDLLEANRFIKACEHHIAQIVSHCDTIACILGAPIQNNDPRGKNLFNAAYFIENQSVKHIVHKALLPNYDVFDEYRYFEPTRDLQCITFKGVKIALTICEDLWNIGNDPLYLESPMDVLIKERPELMINIAASPFSYTHHQERLSVLQHNCRTYRLPLLYVNQVGSQTEIIFDGSSTAFDAQGKQIHEMPAFVEAMQLYEFDAGQLAVPATEILPFNKQKSIHDALVLGIRDYFQKSGFKKAILGLSGGIDSALVCVLATKALGAKNVMAVLMPSEFSSDHSIKDAIDLVNNLGCEHHIVPIKEPVDAFNHILKPIFGDLPFDIAEENIQSRCRAIILMALSNKFGYVLLNTSNKSELAVGYGTLYGDMAGAIGVIGDLYKTQVYDLCDYINREQEIIPTNTITKAPSAELRPGQKDADSLPDYTILDQILKSHIELQKGAKEIITQGLSEAIVHRILKLVNQAEFKRRQSPPILRISPKAFGMSRRMPIVGVADC